MAEDNTEIFIDSVRRFPCLYDPQNQGYKDVEVKRNAWLEVTKITGEDESSAKLRWKRLRDYYKNCLPKLKTTTGQAAKKFKKWSYFEQMEFLQPTLIHPSTQSNISSPSDEGMDEHGTDTYYKGDDDDDDDTVEIPSTSTTFVPRSKRKQEKISTAENVLQTYFEKKMAADNAPKKTDIDKFFEGIAETVKKLPPLAQNKIKMKVSELVYSEEQNLLVSQLSNSDNSF